MKFARITFAALTVIAFTAAAAAKPVTLSAETNLRAAPGTKSEVVTLIPKGSEIEVGDCDAGWCKVKFGDKEGFAIGRNIGEAPAKTAATSRTTSQGKIQGNSQANLQKLRQGYEGYFDGNGRNDVTGSIDEPDSADTPPRTAQNKPSRATPPRNVRPQYDDEDDYYDDDGPAVAYVPARPPVYYSYGPYPRAYGWGRPYYYRRW